MRDRELSRTFLEKTQELYQLLGKTVSFYVRDVRSDELRLELDDGSTALFYHFQDCCEKCGVASVTGDLEDLVGTPLLMAEVVVSEKKEIKEFETQTWSFLKFRTVIGSVTVAWLGESNGYYTETIALDFLNP